MKTPLASFMSRYRPRYVRTLAYMLQSCEYSVSESYRWYKRTRDFAHIEHRKRLERTPKAVGLLVAGWAVQAVIYAIALWWIWEATSAISWIRIIILLAAAPYLVAGAVMLALAVMRAIQVPVERTMVNKAARIFAAHKGLKIAIAGSYGKTSMREILKTTLSAGKRVAAPGENHNTPIGIARFAETLTGDEEVIILELGEYYPGDIAKLCQVVHPDIGVITGVSEAHLERFGTIEKAADTIFELAAWPKLKMLCLNGEDPIASTRAPAGSIAYDRNTVDGWTIRDARTGLEGTSFSFVRKNESLSLHSSLLGLHQVGPLALAAYIARSLGIAAPDIERGIAATKPFAHRLEPKPMSNGAIKLDDSYNGNPAGAAAVIDFLAQLSGHKRIYVTPGLVEMGDRTEAVHKEIGKRIAAVGIEKTVLIRDSVTPYIEAGLTEAGYKGEVVWFDEALKAYASLPHMTVPGDVVLLQNDWPDQYA